MIIESQDIIKVNYDWFSIYLLKNDGAVTKALVDEQTKTIGWEPHLVNFLKFNLDTSSYFIDIGSNFGWHSIIASKICKKVYSFEPQKLLYQLQQKTILENNINNIIIYNLGIGEKNKKSSIRNIDYSYPQVNTGDAWIIDNGNDIDIIMLDSLSIEKADFIKIDVQGYEKFVLEGALETIKKFQPILIIELEEFQLRRYNYGSKEIFKIMNDLEYYPFFLEAQYPCDHVFVPMSKIDKFKIRHQQYISNLLYNNELNNNLLNGVKQKINYA